MLKEKGKQYVIIMWCNWKIDLTEKQLEYVRNYENKRRNRQFNSK